MKKESRLSSLTRRRTRLGAGFIDMVKLAPHAKAFRASESNWQEAFLPPQLLRSSEMRITAWYGVIFGLIAIIVLTILLGRLWQLQVVEGSANFQASEGNRFRIRSLPASRGVVYDRSGFILANNVPGFRLITDTAGLRIARLQEIADGLTSLTGLSPAEIMTKLTFNSQPEAVIVSGLSRDRALGLEVKLADWPEVRVAEEPIRNYPNGALLAHLIGYVGDISPDEINDPKYSGSSGATKIGRSGVEASYDYLLRGRDGRELVEVDSSGRTERVVAREESVAGRNLVLTVDLDMSRVLQEQLVKQMGLAKSKKGAVVALNPQDGAILAYISWPSFDPNIFSQGISQEDYQKLLGDPNQPLFDRVISGSYPPGSTFKPYVATAALSEGVTTKDRLIDSPGVVYLGTQAFRNWNPNGLGQQSIVDALGWSNDIYFYYMGYELGVDRLSDWAKRFGFGETSGIKLPGEASGLVPTKSWKQAVVGQPWYPGDNYNFGIGQGYLLVTPLQLVGAVAAVGNGGKLYQPLLVKEVRDSANLVVSRDNPVLRRSNLATSRVLEVVKDGMKEACTIFVNFYGDLACKTGTAEFGGESANPHALFTVFAPVENPEIALAVIIEAGGHGSVVSAPVTKPTLAKYMR